jgi:hypothetical protein
MSNLTREEQVATFEHIFRRLAQHRNTVELWVNAEHDANESPLSHRQSKTEELMKEIDSWANALAQNAWLECNLKESGKGELFEMLTTFRHLILVNNRVSQHWSPG